MSSLVEAVADASEALRLDPLRLGFSFFLGGILQAISKRMSKEADPKRIFVCFGEIQNGFWVQFLCGGFHPSGHRARSLWSREEEVVVVFVLVFLLVRLEENKQARGFFVGCPKQRHTHMGVEHSWPNDHG